MHRYLDTALADFRRANPQYAPPPEEESAEDASPDVVDSTASDAEATVDISTDNQPSDGTGGDSDDASDRTETTSSDGAEPPERSPRSRRRSLRDDTPDDGSGDSRPRFS